MTETLLSSGMFAPQAAPTRSDRYDHLGEGEVGNTELPRSQPSELGSLILCIPIARSGPRYRFNTMAWIAGLAFWCLGAVQTGPLLAGPLLWILSLRARRSTDMKETGAR